MNSKAGSRSPLVGGWACCIAADIVHQAVLRARAGGLLRLVVYAYTLSTGKALRAKLATITCNC